MTIAELLEQFPLSQVQVKAVLDFAARSLEVPARAS